MQNYHLNPQAIQQIMTKYDLGQVVKFEEVKAGLLNPVYLINDKYILRIEQHRYEHNPNKLKRESILFQILPKFGIPTPKLIGFDDSKEIIDKSYIILHFIPGQNLEQAFGSLTSQQQQNVSRQLGELAKKIHSLSTQAITNPLFGTVQEWVAKSIQDFESCWLVVKDTDYLSTEIKAEIIDTFGKFKQLNWKNMGILTHGDFSTGNIQIDKGEIVGVFDFEYAFIADPLWDLQKLSVSFQLGSGFSREEFLRGYGRTEFSDSEKIRLRMHSFHQGIWEIWAALTDFMPFGDKDKGIEEGKEIVEQTARYRVLK